MDKGRRVLLYNRHRLCGLFVDDSLCVVMNVAVNPAQYITPMAPSVTRSYHPEKYQVINSRLQIHKFSFFPRTVIWWNALPGNIIASPSVEAFRGAVAAHI